MGIGIWELVLLLMIPLVLFGTKRLRTIGTDLGSAIKGFRSAMNEPDEMRNAATIQGKEVADRQDTVNG